MTYIFLIMTVVWSQKSPRIPPKWHDLIDFFFKSAVAPVRVRPAQKNPARTHFARTISQRLRTRSHPRLRTHTCDRTHARTHSKSLLLCLKMKAIFQIIWSFFQISTYFFSIKANPIWSIINMQLKAIHKNMIYGCYLLCFISESETLVVSNIIISWDMIALIRKKCQKSLIVI